MPEKMDQFLDLLLEALAERQAENAGGTSGDGAVAGARRASPSPRPRHDERQRAQQRRATPRREPAQAQSKRAQAPLPQPGEPGWAPPPERPGINLDRTVARLMLLVLVLAVAVNIPVNRYGTSLARILPDSTSIIVRDGLVLKGSGAEIYVLEDNQLRWITSLDLFQHLGYRWDDVREVDDAFLEQFEEAEPLYELVKCDRSPHVFRIENGRKRWIKDIETFEAEGHQWEDIRFVACHLLSRIPDGPPIPDNAGVPLPPLP